MAGTWYVAPALVALRSQLNALHPGRDKSTDGSIGDAAHNARKSDHNADWDSSPPGIVRALDIDRDMIPGDLARSLVATQAIVDALIRDQRTAYLIYRSRIWTPSKGWSPYTAAGKVGWFNPHEQHFHISLRHGALYERDTSPWPVGATLAPPPTTILRPTPSPSEEDTMSPAQEKYFNDQIQALGSKLNDLVGAIGAGNGAGLAANSTVLAHVRGIKEDTWDIRLALTNSLPLLIAGAKASADPAQIAAAEIAEGVLDGLAKRLKD